jgi:hypothetical protein
MIREAVAKRPAVLVAFDLLEVGGEEAEARHFRQLNVYA